jgi:hypothetical protein
MTFLWLIFLPGKCSTTRILGAAETGVALGRLGLHFRPHLLGTSFDAARGRDIVRLLLLSCFAADERAAITRRLANGTGCWLAIENIFCGSLLRLHAETVGG